MLYGRWSDASILWKQKNLPVVQILLNTNHSVPCFCNHYIYSLISMAMKQALYEHLNGIIKYAVIFLCIAFLLLITENVLFSQSSVCLFHRFTGCQCPLCGMTHASVFLVKMHPVMAFSYNPSVLWFPFLLIMEIFHDLFPRQNKIRLIRKATFIGFGCTLLLVFAFRIMNCIR